MFNKRLIRLAEYYQEQCSHYRQLQTITLEMQEREAELPYLAVHFAVLIEKRQDIINGIKTRQEFIQSLWSMLQSEQGIMLTPDNLPAYLPSYEADIIQQENLKIKKIIKEVIDIDIICRDSLMNAQNMIKREHKSLHAIRNASKTYNAPKLMNEGIFVDVKAV